MKSMETNKRTWREVHDERKRRKTEKIIKKLDKLKAREEEEKLNNSIAEKNSRAKVNESYTTCSIAVPGSILENTQTLELRTYVAGQIARAACIYKINEIVVFDDTCENKGKSVDEKFTNRNCVQFARILQYLECPQYLRKHFFPIHNDLKYIGLVNPLGAPHHLRDNEECEFREGIVTNKSKKSGGRYVDVGLTRQVGIKDEIDCGLRVTIRLEPISTITKKRYGAVVSPDTPILEKKLYWGYTVRVANSLSELLLKCPYTGGYDITIGTSDKGKNIDAIDGVELRKYKHMLIVFGGLQGLEVALDNDDFNIEHPSLLFDLYVNTCPEQGSRTIRTEEAVLITLAEFRNKLK